MPEDQVHPSISNTSEQDAADRLAIEKACQLIDSYVQEMRQQRSSAFNPAELKWHLLDGSHRTTVAILTQ
jgi:hypothetical protein